MRPQGKPAELFAAFSRITGKAFAADRLLSCSTLSKAPNYGDVLRRFLTAAPVRQAGAKTLLQQAFVYLLNNAGHFCFMLLARLYIAVLGWKIPEGLGQTPPLGGEKDQHNPPPAAVDRDSLPNGKKEAPLIIDSFALLPGIAAKGAYQEGYLPGLCELALQNGRRPIRLYRLYGSRNPLVLWKAMKVLARNGEGLTEMHLLSGRDWLLLLFHVFAYPHALRKLVLSLAPPAPHSPEAYIRDALIATSGQNILTGESRRLAGFRLGLLLAGHVRPEDAPLLVSWYENQTVDKALHRGLRLAEAQSKRHIPTLGAQLFIWPDSLLNNHPDDGEAALGLTPDRILVNGSWFLPEDSTQKYAVGPALRYAHLFAPLDGAKRKPASPGSGPKEGKDLLALLSYHPLETRRVLSMLLPLARKGVAVRYKFHPATRAEDYADLLPPTPLFASGSLVDALRTAEAVIGSGSGSLAEAAALGVPVLAVRDPSGIPGLDLQYLPPFGEDRLWAGVCKATDIEPALERLRAFKNSEAHEAAVCDFRARLFSRPDAASIKQAFCL